MCLVLKSDTVLQLQGTVFLVTYLPALHRPSTMVCMQWSALHKSMLVMAGYVGDRNVDGPHRSHDRAAPAIHSPAQPVPGTRQDTLWTDPAQVPGSGVYTLHCLAFSCTGSIEDVVDSSFVSKVCRNRKAISVVFSVQVESVHKLPNMGHPLLLVQLLHWSACKAQAHVLLLQPVHVILIFML